MRGSKNKNKNPAGIGAAAIYNTPSNSDTQTQTHTPRHTDPRTHSHTHTNVCMHEQGRIHCIGNHDLVTLLVIHFACFCLTQTRSIWTLLCVTSCSACRDNVVYWKTNRQIKNDFRVQMVFDDQTGNQAYVHTLDPMQHSIKTTNRKTQSIKMCITTDQNASKIYNQVASSCGDLVNADV